MKLLMIGSNNVWSIDKLYYKHIKETGTAVELLPTFTYYLQYRNRSVISKILHRLGLSAINSRITALVKKKVDEFAPDVVWIFKGMEITPQTVMWLKKKGIYMVNYNPDNPFVFTDRGSGNRYVTNSIFLYDLHLTYNHEIKKKLEQQLKLRAALLPFGYEISEEIYNESEEQEEIIKTCFIGTPDSKRIAFLKELADKGISYDVYGNGWDKMLKHPNITTHKAVYGKEFWKVLRKYRVQLNLMRLHNEDSHNMRTFEVPGIGGIMVAPETTEHRNFFEDGKEVFLYKNADDCIAVIKKLLTMSISDALAIRMAARYRSVTSGYSYKARAKQALQEIELHF